MQHVIGLAMGMSEMYSVLRSSVLVKVRSGGVAEQWLGPTQCARPASAAVLNKIPTILVLLTSASVKSFDACGGYTCVRHSMGCTTTMQSPSAAAAAAAAAAFICLVRIRS